MTSTYDPNWNREKEKKFVDDFLQRVKKQKVAKKEVITKKKKTDKK
jgi:hypothetical protein